MNVITRVGLITPKLKCLEVLQNCPTAVCNPQVDAATNKLIGYTFDNAGNTKVDPQNRTFIYDGENKQVEVKDADGNSIGRYFYDGDGRRVKKISLTETTVFVYDAIGQLISEHSTNIAPTQTAKVSYLTNDHLGSPRITTDQNGQVVSRQDFQPFGEEIARANYGADSVRQKFTGYIEDEETELKYSWARYYPTIQGRFQTPDPFWGSALSVSPQTWNRYIYCLNNPLVFTDPLGLTWLQKGNYYYWIDDKDYEKNQKYFDDNGYLFVPNDTIIHLADEQDKNSTSEAKKFAGKYVKLGDNNKVTEVDYKETVMIEWSGDPLPEVSTSIRPSVLRCSRPTDILYIINAEHHWLKTDKKEVGAGQDPNDPRNADGFFLPYMKLMDHKDASFAPEASCILMPGVDVNIVNSELKIGKPLEGRFFLGNNCQTFVDKVLKNAQPLSEPRANPKP